LWQIDMQGRNRKARRLNRTLVAALKQRECIRSPAVEAAFLEVPRHRFLPNIPLERAYANQAIPTKVIENRAVSSASQPAMIAIMLEQLALQPGHRVLEIGAGTGYNAALMAHMVGAAGRVVTMDIDEDLVESARRHLAAVGVDNVLVVCADGGYGYAGAAPYDRIILTVGVSDISPHWWAQLKPNGRIVLPLEIGAGPKSVAFDWRGDCLRSNSVRECAFIKLRGEFAEMQMNLLPVGPVAGLDLIPSERATELPHSEDIYAWLMQPHATWSTGVRVLRRARVVVVSA
jgi:protein-L-isoaspartate(D-aspartate) O-methyltransferase